MARSLSLHNNNNSNFCGHLVSPSKLSGPALRDAKPSEHRVPTGAAKSRKVLKCDYSIFRGVKDPEFSCNCRKVPKEVVKFDS